MSGNQNHEPALRTSAFVCLFMGWVKFEWCWLIYSCNQMLSSVEILTEWTSLHTQPGRYQEPRATFQATPFSWKRRENLFSSVKDSVELKALFPRQPLKLCWPLFLCVFSPWETILSRWLTDYPPGYPPTPSLHNSTFISQKILCATRGL